jgi:bifunctional NMN adenylyltransferase/nudix hydrolase
MSDVRERSTTKAYDLAVLILRAQLFHRGHAGVVLEALKTAERVLLLVGSANLGRDTRNPWTFTERRAVILRAIHDIVHEANPDASASVIANAETALVNRIDIVALDDAPYDVDGWLTNVHTFVRNATPAVQPRVCLIGNKRDASSDYLDMFPRWPYLAVTDTRINATAIRKSYFDTDVDLDRKGWTDKGIVFSEVLYPSTIEFLRRFRSTSFFEDMIRERAAEEAYREKYGSGPFLTVDPVVVQSGYVLLIERGGAEGNGKWALPGGFLNPYERLLDGAARECVEETNIFWGSQMNSDAQKAHLKTFVKRSYRFDDPYRSRRASIVTDAFLFRLPDGHSLPRVEGRDDAKKAFWLPISEVRPDQMYDDHAFIIQKLLSL